MSVPTLAEVIRNAVEFRLGGVHTAIPGRVESYDADDQRATIKPLVKSAYLDESGSKVTEALPVIPDVPVCFPGGGGFRLTFPIAKGDTGLLIFSEASLDVWLSHGGDVDPQDGRRFDLADAVFLPGLKPFSSPWDDAPTDGAAFGFDGGVEVRVTEDEVLAGGSSALATKADIDALISTFNSHVHGGVTSGASLTSTPGTPAGASSGTQVLKGS